MWHCHFSGKCTGKNFQILKWSVRSSRSSYLCLEAAASAKPAKSRQDLIQKIKEAWDKVITEEYVVKTCASVPRRRRAMIVASGGHIEGLKKKKEDKEDEEENADAS